jgi:hypothetical protein
MSILHDTKERRFFPALFPAGAASVEKRLDIAIS